MCLRVCVCLFVDPGHSFCLPFCFPLLRTGAHRIEHLLMYWLLSSYMCSTATAHSAGRIYVCFPLLRTNAHVVVSFVCLCVCLFVCVFVCSFHWWFVCLGVLCCLLFCKFVLFFDGSFVWLLVCLCACLIASWFDCLFVCVSVCLLRCWKPNWKANATSGVIVCNAAVRWAMPNFMRYLLMCLCVCACLFLDPGH